MPSPEEWGPEIPRLQGHLFVGRASQRKGQLSWDTGGGRGGYQAKRNPPAQGAEFVPGEAGHVSEPQFLSNSGKRDLNGGAGEETDWPRAFPEPRRRHREVVAMFPRCLLCAGPCPRASPVTGDRPRCGCGCGPARVSMAVCSC